MLTFAEWRAQGARGEFHWRKVQNDRIGVFRYEPAADLSQMPEEERAAMERIYGRERYGADELPLPRRLKPPWLMYRVASSWYQTFPPGGWAEVMAELGLTDETPGATSLNELLLYEQTL